MYAKLEAIMCRSWYVFLLITGTERRSAAKIKMRDWFLFRDRSIIDFRVVHLYLFGTEHAVILYSGRNKEIISLVRRTSVTSNLLVRHSHHLSNK